MRVAALAALLALAAPAAAAKRPLPGLRSPSGNITCFAILRTPAVLHCQIRQAAYSARLVAYCGQPRIGVDWAGFSLGVASRAGVECSGGVIYDPDRERPVFALLPYGHTWRSSGFTCVSRVTGVTCTSRAGHGLFVSRESWRGW